MTQQLITQTSDGTNLVTGDTYYREYNSLGQLTNIYQGSDNSTLLGSYTYDPLGKRIKTYNSITNTTIYTPFKEFMQIRNSTGIFNYTYVYADGVLVARINPDGSKWFYHADHLGSTTLITNETGDVVEEVAYYPYGLPLEEQGNEIRLYEGKELDSTDQYYFGARYYHPSMRMFTQPDDLIPDVYDPQALNIYAFERGNPYGYMDPTGNAGVINRGQQPWQGFQANEFYYAIENIVPSSEEVFDPSTFLGQINSLPFAPPLEGAYSLFEFGIGETLYQANRGTEERGINFASTSNYNPQSSREDAFYGAFDIGLFVLNKFNVGGEVVNFLSGANTLSTASTGENLPERFDLYGRLFGDD